ncbi:MAG: ATP-binding cassette domain-containing protein [Thermoproteota archaeon]
MRFDVKAGEIICMLGPNGADNTTLVRILSTLLFPDGGWARVGGYDMVSQANKI